MILEFCSNILKKFQKSEVKPQIMIPSRVQLVQATGLLSSYKKKSNPALRWDVSVFKEGSYVCTDMLEALIQLDAAVTAQKGTLYITDLTRTWELQQKRRDDYVSKVKPAYAAVPGGSYHQAGRAVDFSTSELNFQGIPKDQWLKKFWDIARPLGFFPIIKIPDLNKSECWHFDFPGKAWEKAYDYMDDFSSDAIDYTLIAKCCILDVGKWDPKENPDKVVKMFIQAQLIRLGKYEIGTVDGLIGAKSWKAIQSLGITATDLNQVSQLLAGM